MSEPTSTDDLLALADAVLAAEVGMEPGPWDYHHVNDDDDRVYAGNPNSPITVAGCTDHLESQAKARATAIGIAVIRNAARPLAEAVKRLVAERQTEINAAVKAEREAILDLIFFHRCDPTMTNADAAREALSAYQAAIRKRGET